MTPPQPRPELSHWQWWSLVATALLLPLLLAPTLAPLLGWRLDSVITRSMMLLGGVALLLRFGRPTIAWWRDCLGPRPWRGVGLAWLTTLGCCALYSLVMVSLGAEALRPELFRPDRLGTALATGLLVSCIEEPVFRRVLLRRLGAVLSSAIYALAHYIRPTKVPTQPSYGLDDSLAVYRDMLSSCLEPLHDPAPFLGLLLLGLLLCAVARRRGLGWSIGIHAGLVYYIKADSCLLYWNYAERHWWFGSMGYKYDGAMFWLACATSLLLIALWPGRQTLPTKGSCSNTGTS